MNNPLSLAKLRQSLGAPSSDTIESLRLLRSFLKLAPRQRFEVIEIVERLASESCSVPGRPLS
jgi:hypothetical protein